MKWLWPIRTGKTFFDYWSVAHLSFWLVVGATLAAFNCDRIKSYLIALAVAYAWEGFERFAEVRWPNVWQSPESTLNAFVSDPLMCFLGLFLAFLGYDHGRP